jgi:hypothetical protein
LLSWIYPSEREADIESGAIQLAFYDNLEKIGEKQHQTKNSSMAFSFCLFVFSLLFCCVKRGGNPFSKAN